MPERICRHFAAFRMIVLALLISIAATPALSRCYFLECDGPPASQPSTPVPSSPTPLPAPTPNQPAGRTYWNHNGSTMYLVVSGARREFYYQQPRQGMVEEGVRPGTLLFSGTVAGNSYEGIAYLFSAKCGSRPYQVRGSVQESGGRVIMAGTAPLVDRNCNVVRTIPDTLVFDYLYR